MGVVDLFGLYWLAFKARPVEWLFIWLLLIMSIVMTGFMMSFPTVCIKQGMGLKYVSSREKVQLTYGSKKAI